LTNKIKGFLLANMHRQWAARDHGEPWRNRCKKKLKRGLRKSGDSIDLWANVGWKPAMLDANQQQ
jgi:hypothetical protein